MPSINNRRKSEYKKKLPFAIEEGVEGQTPKGFSGKSGQKTLS
jgi:hypothetical protein